jgi:FKBP-type peptidyl-prolyl cis-trans isomerase
MHNTAGNLMTKLLRIFLLMLMFPPLAGTAMAGPMQTTPAGTRYRDLQPGSGETAAPGDIATMHFMGWLDDRGSKGREFYNSRKQGEPVSFVIGSARVMPGWNDGIVGMRPGGRRLLLLPPALGYGAKGVQGIVPPDASLIFIIELLDLEKHAGN